MLTIAIPTRGRPGRALAKARYWAKQGCAVHVMDGSDGRDAHADASNHFRVSYHHVPGSTIASRLAQVGGLVDTPYVMLQPDDDVFLPRALESIIASLENDQTAVGASGIAVRIQKSGFGLCLLKVAYPQMLEKAVGVGINSPTLTNHMQNYFPTAIYGLLRSEVFKNVVKNLAYLKTSLYGIEELFFEIGARGQGNIISIPQVYWIRDSSLPKVEIRSQAPFGQANPWFLLPDSLEYKGFVKGVSEVFALSTVATGGAGTESAERGIEAYRNFFLNKRKLATKKTTEVRRLSTSLKTLFLPKKLRLVLRFVQNFIVAVSIPSKRSFAQAFPQPLFTFLREADKAGVKLDKVEFLSVVKSR